MVPEKKWVLVLVRLSTELTHPLREREGGGVRD